MGQPVRGFVDCRRALLSRCRAGTRLSEPHPLVAVVLRDQRSTSGTPPHGAPMQADRGPLRPGGVFSRVFLFDTLHGAGGDWSGGRRYDRPRSHAPNGERVGVQGRRCAGTYTRSGWFEGLATRCRSAGRLECGIRQLARPIASTAAGCRRPTTTRPPAGGPALAELITSDDAFRGDVSSALRRGLGGVLLPLRNSAAVCRVSGGTAERPLFAGPRGRQDGGLRDIFGGEMDVGTKALRYIGFAVE